MLQINFLNASEDLRISTSHETNGQAYLRRSPRIGSRIYLSQPLCVLIVGVWAAILFIGLIDLIGKIGKIGITERENEAMDISQDISLEDHPGKMEFAVRFTRKGQESEDRDWVFCYANSILYCTSPTTTPTTLLSTTKIWVTELFKASPPLAVVIIFWVFVHFRNFVIILSQLTFFATELNWTKSPYICVKWNIFIW